jgi:hypothetical protein
MSLQPTHLAGLAATLAALRLVPDQLKIPDHYWISTFAQKTVGENQRVIDAIPSAPAGLTDVTWPFLNTTKQLLAASNHVFYKPLVAIAALVEQTVRGDFGSSVEMSEKNLEALKAQNVVYEEELKKLTPVADLLVRITEMAQEHAQKLSVENAEAKESVELRSKQVEAILEARKDIDVDAAMQSLEKVVSIALKTLEDPTLIRKLKTNAERLEKNEQDLAAAEKDLTEASDLFQEKTDQLKKLMGEYEQLGAEEVDIFDQLQKQGKSVLERAKTLQSSHQMAVARGSTTPIIV